MGAVQRDRSDGDLPSARRRLEDAVAELTEPRSDGHGHHAPSLYMQLADTLGGEQGSGWNGSPQSQPPLYVAAADLLVQIDVAVQCWNPMPAGVPPTVGRLRALVHGRKGSGWRPQDCHAIDQITRVCELWVQEIQTLLEPEAIKNFRNPAGDGFAACPQCQRTTTYRIDPSDGESKRVPVLQWTQAVGTQCIVCKAHWEPNKTLWVSQLLGFNLPTGVLE